MRNALANLGITEVSNRALMEMTKRTYQKQLELADVAGKVPPGDGRALKAAVLKYLREHPLFSNDELRNPALLGSKEPPAAIARNPQALQQWATQQGLKPGDPFMFQGNLRQIPGGAQ